MQPKASVFIATSLDGFIARLDGSVDWLEHDSGGEDYGFRAFMDTVDGLVMGRNTFEVVRTSEDWYYGETPLIVASKSLAEQDIPARLRGRVALSRLEPQPLMAELGARGMQHVYVDGGRLIQSFLREDLIAELILTRIPLLLGEGIPLFGPLGRDVPLQHLGSESFASGLTQSGDPGRGAAR